MRIVRHKIILKHITRALFFSIYISVRWYFSDEPNPEYGAITRT
jgi:hypothetical protein